MRLTVLGSGSPEPHPRRASSGYLVETGGGDRILMDCGGGVFDNLLRSGRMPGEITHLVFSHLHSDHMMDYARLVHAAWDGGAPPLKVWGPAPLAAITAGYFGPSGVLAHDLAARTELGPSKAVWLARGGTLPRPWPAPVVTEIAPGAVIEGAGWRITTCRAPHAQPFLECLALRIDAGGRSLTYSGDAGLCPEIEALARGTDCLLHWCYRAEGARADPEMEALAPTPSEIAAMAARAGVGRLLLTHFRAGMDRGAVHAAARAAMAGRFAGPCGIVEDLQAFEI